MEIIDLPFIAHIIQPDNWTEDQRYVILRKLPPLAGEIVPEMADILSHTSPDLVRRAGAGTAHRF